MLLLILLLVSLIFMTSVLLLCIVFQWSSLWIKVANWRLKHWKKPRSWACLMDDSCLSPSSWFTVSNYTLSGKSSNLFSTITLAIPGRFLQQLCWRVILSVCPSVTRVLCDETNEYTAVTLTPHEVVINPVYWYRRRLVGDVPFHLKFALKVTHSFKNADFDLYVSITSQQLYRIWSRPCAFRRAINEVRILILTPPKGGSKSEFVVLWIKSKLNRIKSATEFICVKTSSGKVVLELLPHLKVYICWR